MSATPKRFTLLEFVKDKMPDRWARYMQLRAPTPFGMHSLGVVNLFHPEGRTFLNQVGSEHDAIVEDLKKLLPDCELVADDASGRQLTLERRHWADAQFEIEKSAIQHGKQRWTNIEVREALKAGPPLVSETVVKTEPALGRRRGRKAIVRASAAEWLKSRYPSGLPQTKKNIELLAELRADGINISEKTLRRALGLA
jgi:hypothetical protein